MSDETTTTETTTEAAPPAQPDAPASEAKPAEAEQPAKPAKPGADAWAKLRAAEEKVRREREEAKAAAKKTAEERAEIERLKADIEAQRKRLSLDAFDGDPAAFLEAHKIDYDDLTRRMLSKPSANKPRTSKEIEELRAELAALKQASEEEKKANATKAQEAAWARVFETFEAEIKPPSEGDHAYELLHHEYQADPDFIRNTLREMAELAPELTVAQAAARLEEYYLEQTKSRLALRKVRGLYSPSGETKQSSQQAQQATKDGQPAGEGGPRTLSHVDSSERATSVAPPKPLHEMTLYERRQWERESEARAVRALEEKWNSRSA